MRVLCVWPALGVVTELGVVVVRGIPTHSSTNASRKARTRRWGIASRSSVRSHGLTVAKVARAVGLSPRQLTAIERGIARRRLTRCIGWRTRSSRPFEYFLPRSRETQRSLFHPKESGAPLSHAPLGRADGTQPGVLYYPLITDPIDRGLHPYLLRFSPNTPAQPTSFCLASSSSTS
mgnify:CR=1 FL=1